MQWWGDNRSLSFTELSLTKQLRLIFTLFLHEFGQTDTYRALILKCLIFPGCDKMK